MCTVVTSAQNELDEKSQRLRVAIENYRPAKELVESAVAASCNFTPRNSEVYSLSGRQLNALSVTDVMIRDALRLRGLVEHSILRWLAADGAFDYYPDPYAIITTTTAGTSAATTLSLSQRRLELFREKWMPRKKASNNSTNSEESKSRRRWTTSASGHHQRTDNLPHSMKPQQGDKESMNRYFFYNLA